MAKLYSLARMTTATTGTGTITLGAAVSGYLSFANAGVATADIVEYAIKDGSNSEIGTGTYTSAGTTLTRNVTKSTNSNAAISLSGTAEVFISPRAERLKVPRGYLSGLTLSTAGSSTTFSVAAGQAADSTNLETLDLAASINKTTSAWAVGTGNGSLDTGSITASTWYHAYLIYRPDTQVVDVLVSLSATSPTSLPTNYTLFRRIGAMKTNGSSQWTSFTQNGDEFLWLAPVTDANGLTLSTTAALKTLTVPTGVNVRALFNGLLFQSGATTTYVLFYPPDIGTQVATGGANQSLSATGTSGAQFSADFFRRTNTSAQVGVVSNTTSGTYYIDTLGWIDDRGKLS